MATNELLKRLVEIYSGEKIRYPKLKVVTLAQWMLESGRGTSELSIKHYNFGGLKWRPEMTGYATKISYDAHDGKDDYCKFATIENFLNGYWVFLNRAPYSGWEDHVTSAEEFIRFIGPIYTPTPDYADRVLALMPEAEQLLKGAHAKKKKTKSTSNVTKLGTIVIDPGHGGSSNVAGSSANNAISLSGVKEKKLTLDFSLILRDQLLSQSQENNEAIEVFLTRTTDVNLTGKARAGLAFEKKAKLFLCIHFNGSNDNTIRGAETFYRAKSNGNLNLEDDNDFAKAMQLSLMSGLKSIDPTAIDRGVKPDTDTGPGALGVLNDKNLGNDKISKISKMCRSAYIEAEFITHPTVEEKLISGPSAVANRTIVLASLAGAIRAYMRTIS